MFTNFLRAKMNTHTLTLIVGVLFFAAHHFFSDLQVSAYLQSHWVARLLETTGATLVETAASAIVRTHQGLGLDDNNLLSSTADAQNLRKSLLP